MRISITIKGKVQIAKPNGANVSLLMQNIFRLAI
jgi:hypothetical protein